MWIIALHLTVARLATRMPPDLTGEEGFSTAELLGNAALGVAALVVIWAGMEALGVEVMAWIRSQLIS